MQRFLLPEGWRARASLGIILREIFSPSGRVWWRLKFITESMSSLFLFILLLHKQETSVKTPAGHPLSLSNHPQPWAVGFGLQARLALVNTLCGSYMHSAGCGLRGGGSVLTLSQSGGGRRPGKLGERA